MSSDLRKKIKKTVKRLGETILVQTLVLLAVTLPRRAGLSLFTFFGMFSYRCCRKDRVRAHENIARAFPGTPAVVVKAIAAGVFRSLGRNWLDTLRLTRQTKRQVLESCLVTGEENLRRALSRGRGVLAVTGHIGALGAARRLPLRQGVRRERDREEARQRGAQPDAPRSEAEARDRVAFTAGTRRSPGTAP